MRRRLAVACAAIAACALGCSRSPLLPGVPALDEGAGGASSSSDAATSSSSAGQGGAPYDGGTIDPIPEEIWVNGATTLHRLDLVAMSLVDAVPFQGCGGDAVIDIAASSTGQLYATTYQGLFSVDPTTGQCTQLATGSYPTSLAVVPKGILHADREALVGFDGAVYVEMSLDDGTYTVLGGLGNHGYISSGDLVVLPKGQAFLTVKGADCADCLVRVDPVSGALLALVSHLPYPNAYGLASSYGKAFAFTANGEAFRVDLGTGATQLLTVTGTLPMGGYFGAASRPMEQ